MSTYESKHRHKTVLIDSTINSGALPVVSQRETVTSAWKQVVVTRERIITEEIIDNRPNKTKQTTSLKRTHDEKAVARRLKVTDLRGTRAWHRCTHRECRTDAHE